MTAKRKTKPPLRTLEELNQDLRILRRQLAELRERVELGDRILRADLNILKAKFEGELQPPQHGRPPSLSESHADDFDD